MVDNNVFSSFPANACTFPHYAAAAAASGQSVMDNIVIVYQVLGMCVCVLCCA